MKAGGLLKFGVFIAVFVGIVSFYVFYGEQSALDSVFFVVLTVSTVGYDDKIAPTITIRLFTVFTMLFGIFFLFTYIKNVVHHVGMVLKRQVLPSLSLQHYVGGLVVVSFSSLFVILAVGTVFVYFNEGLHFVVALYFIVYTATTVGYGGVPIRFHSTKIFLIFYVLIAPILLAISFDSILSLPMRIRRKQLMTDLLMNRVSLAGVMVDLELQQRRVQRQRRRQRQRRQAHPYLRRFTSSSKGDTAARNEPANIVVTPGQDSHQYHIEPVSGRSESKSSHHSCEDPELQIEAAQADQADQADHLSEHSDSDNSGVLFGRTQCESPTKAGLFGLPDGASVSKYEFVLSVLLYLGKIQYEKDVYVWRKKFDHLDAGGAGSVSKEEMLDVCAAVVEDG